MKTTTGRGQSAAEMGCLHRMRCYASGCAGPHAGRHPARLGLRAAIRRIRAGRVTGRVTRGGHPLGEMWIVFEEDGPRGAVARGLVRTDGSFRMQLWGSLGPFGVMTGTYRVRFVPNPPWRPGRRSTIRTGIPGLPACWSMSGRAGMTSCSPCPNRHEVQPWLNINEAREFVDPFGPMTSARCGSPPGTRPEPMCRRRALR